MDPVSAVGLAGTVIQFVTFTSSLLSAAAEIHNSKSGSPADLGNILTVYQHLESFRAKFLSQNNFGDAQYVEGVSSLRELFCTAKTDCDRIINLVEKLEIKSASFRRWKSFRAALELVWKKSDIEELEKRLQRTQSALTLHICAITSQFHQSYSKQLRSLKNTNKWHHLEQGEKINNVLGILQALKSQHIVEQPKQAEGQASPLAGIIPVLPPSIDELQHQMGNLSVDVQSLSHQQAVLMSLNFQARRRRHGSIPFAHEGTFEWLYDSNSSVAKNQLLEWLRTGKGIFWVTGKPGSGKSTFMKYLADDPRTQQAIASYAYPRKVLTASHFFWHAGTDMQKSLQGLIQEILFQILRQRPDMIPAICPARFLERSSPRLQDQWSLAELRDALRSIASPNLDAQICIFIDGLDEYSGDHAELCQDLKLLASSAHIKICVSSRPWNAFTDAFGDAPSATLRMQDLTEPDIQAYVESQLSKHIQWASLDDQPRSGSLLVREVTQRAQGVFLWVVLTTKLLRDGLTNDDTFTDLFKRLESCPVDLEPFFKHILDSVDPFYHRRMSGFLRIAMSYKSLGFLIYHFHESEYDDSDYALKIKTRTSPIDENELTTLRRKVVRRLECHCKGLLEVGPTRVDFLHRTVADFLLSAGMTEYLRAKGRPSFCPELSILRAQLATFKTIGGIRSEDTWQMLGYYGYEPCRRSWEHEMTTVIRIARRVECDLPGQCDAVEDLLDNLSMSLLDLKPTTSQSPYDDDATSTFRKFILEDRVEEYLRRKLAEDKHYFTPQATSALKPPLAIFTETHAMRFGFEREFDMLKLLLEHGEDPNQTISSCQIDIPSTPWTNFVKEFVIPPTFNSQSCQLLKLFLKHGADRSAQILRQNLHYSTAWLDYLFSCFSLSVRQGEYAAYLEVLDIFFNGDLNMPDKMSLPAFLEGSHSVYEAFFLVVKERTTNPRKCDEYGYKRMRPISLSRQIKLWKTVTLKLLVKARDQDWPMHEIWSTVAEVFGDEERLVMQTRYDELCLTASADLASVSSKRNFEELSSDDGRERKVLKLA